MEIPNNYLDRFKKVNQVTLFDEELDLSPVRKQFRCPYINCGNKLKISADRKSARCTSKGKHPRFYFRAGTIKIEAGVIPPMSGYEAFMKLTK